MARLAAVAAALAAAAGGARAQDQLEIDVGGALNKVDPIYIAFNIDTGSLFNGMNFSDVKLRAYAAQLAPTFVRVGGTAVDYSYYLPDQPYVVGQVNGNAAGNTFYSNEVLDALIGFSQATGATLLLDINGQDFRQGTTGPWQPAGNFTPMIEWIQSKYGAAGLDIAWSLGNEPGLWKIKVQTEQLAQDAVTLKNVVKQYTLGSDVYGASFAGVSVEDATRYLPGAKGVLKGLTVHNYPYARNCNVPSYLSKFPVTKNLAGALAGVAAEAQKVGYDGLLILEETAGSYGGGCDNITNRFVSGFEWLATLNAVAWSGFSRVHRQDLAGWSFAFGKSNYALTGPPGWVNGSAALTPHPDWFTTMLAKQLLGTTILNTTTSSTTNATLPDGMDVWAWCASERAASPAAGAVTLAWANWQGSDVTFSLPAAFGTGKRTEFTLTSSPAAWQEALDRAERGEAVRGVPPPASLQADAVFLNGKPMTVDPATGLLPAYPIPGRVAAAGTPFTAPPYSYGFIVFPTAGVAACQ